MVKNDYRRSLIMLRSYAPGYSGHVRLERRTLIGSMYIAVHAPTTCGTLCAALIRTDARGAYFAVKLGELRRDSRGQATLAYSFDPRNIDGRTLEEYQLIAIVHRDGDGCDVVLSGNVNGSREVNWNSARAAACNACAQPPACDINPPFTRPCPSQPATPGEGPFPLPTPTLPGPSEPATPGEGPFPLPTPTLPGPSEPATPGEGPFPLPTPTLPGPSEPATPGEGPFPLPTPTLPGPSEPATPGEGPFPLPTPVLPDSGGMREESTGDGAGSAVGDGETNVPQTPSAPAEENGGAVAIPASATVQTAGTALGIDMSKPWPGASEALRGLFATQPVRELMLGDGYTYVQAPMPAGSGYDHVDVGVQVRNGAPVSVRYALPSRFTPEPPAGLDDYTWEGGSADGWWTIRTDPETGEIQI